ncbi:hypothetical protein JXA32_03050, partial [Candidatus Sumerlaeota bacterium]|nr:hypothetical protein [Candidatus Sumerlaeota bacterium]
LIIAGARMPQLTALSTTPWGGHLEVESGDVNKNDNTFNATSEGGCATFYFGEFKIDPPLCDSV